MNAISVAYLIVTICAFVSFAVTLFAVSSWVNAKDRKAARPAVQAERSSGWRGGHPA